MVISEQDYHAALQRIDALVSQFKDGENSDADQEILRLAKAVERYEDSLNLDITKPLTLGEAVELHFDKHGLS
jgi:antitoxin component HigA of HigAB toxin-antitoxin module